MALGLATAVAALSLWLATLPPPEQYLFPSLPRPLQRLLGPRSTSEAVWSIQKLPAGPGVTLWALGEGCDELGCRKLSLFLQRGASFEAAGDFAGRLEGDRAPDSEGVNESPSLAPPPLTLVRESARGVLVRQRLVWLDGAYRAGKAERRFLDPLLHARVTAGELERTAKEDLRVGRFALAAGRFALLCQGGCSASEREREGDAALGARLLPQAEAAFRAVIREEPTRGSAWLSLGETLSHEHELAPARAAYEQAARQADPKAAAKARGHLAKLPPP